MLHHKDHRTKLKSINHKLKRWRTTTFLLSFIILLSVDAWMNFVDANAVENDGFKEKPISKEGRRKEDQKSWLRFIMGRISERNALLPALVEIAVLNAIAFLLIPTLIINIIAWLFVYHVHLGIRRTLSSINQKIILAEAALKRRKFSEALIGQLSLLANFDVNVIKTDRTIITKERKL